MTAARRFRRAAAWPGRAITPFGWQMIALAVGLILTVIACNLLFDAMIDPELFNPWPFS